MEKALQKSLQHWLKQQANQHASLALKLSILCGVLSTVALLVQLYSLVRLLEEYVLLNSVPDAPTWWVGFAGAWFMRALLLWCKDVTGERAGSELKHHIRQQLLQRLHQRGPHYIEKHDIGHWNTVIYEQVDALHDFCAHYLPQAAIVMWAPLLILLVLFPLNWGVALILLTMGILLIIAIIVIGKRTAAANQANFIALQRLSGYFYNRVQSLATLKLFQRLDDEKRQLQHVATDFNQRTMQVLRIAFLSSTFIELFIGLSIVSVVVYTFYQFSSGTAVLPAWSGIELLAILWLIVLTPEFLSPLRELGQHYHAKGQAIAAAEAIHTLLNEPASTNQGKRLVTPPFLIDALQVCFPERPNIGPFTFNAPNQQLSLILGDSGCGKTTLMDALLGFAPYSGSLMVNGIEVRDLDLAAWQAQIHWIGQQPRLLPCSVRDNLDPNNQYRDDELFDLLKSLKLDVFANEDGLGHYINERQTNISGGQLQRLAIAKALLQPKAFWLLDEPTAHLNTQLRTQVEQVLLSHMKGKSALWITHDESLSKQISSVIPLQTSKTSSIDSHILKEDRHHV